MNPKQIITRCVEEFESKTQVELVVLIKHHSRQYWDFFWFYTLIFVQTLWITTVLWNDAFEYELLCLESLLLIGFCYLAFIKFELIKYLIPSKIKKSNVRDFAFREFSRLGIFNTRLRSGMLIVYSHLEDECLILADNGVKEKISATEIDDWTKDFNAAFKEKDLSLSVGALIRSFGVYWHTQWPNEDDVNEIAFSFDGDIK